MNPPATTTSREWYRPNPPLPTIQWGPRNNTNIQESAMLFALNKVAKDKETYLENYYIKNKHAIEKGTNGPTFGWVIPAAGQYRKADAADMVNELRRQGVEVSTANSAFQVGKVNVAAGDYIVRGDQPYRTLAEMYFAIQNYPTPNPRPYDDTGWTMEYLRNVKLTPLTENSVLTAPMTLLSADARAAGGVDGGGSTLVIEHTTDNNLMKFRYKNTDVKMLVAEEDFELNGHKLRAGAFIIPNADRAKLEPQLKELGLSAWAVAAAPAVKTHPMSLPRIGYVHTWSSTQDEGWVRAALDYYGVPYTYFATKKLKDDQNLRAKYDVIVFPHAGATQTILNGIGGAQPIPYMKTTLTPNLGVEDSDEDIRGGMGMEGLLNLAKFVQEGGALITEGSTSAMMAEYDLGGGVTVEHPTGLFARGTILRTNFMDLKSPIAYGYEGKDLGVYFNQDPVLNAGAGGAGGGRGGGGGGRGSADVNAQNITPNSALLTNITPLDPENPIEVPVNIAGGGGRGGRGGGGGRGGRGGAAGAPAAGTAADATAAAGGARGGGGGRGGRGAATEERARVILQFPADASKMLLSGTLDGGETLSGRAAAIDVPLGKGHIVMFALRPFWRWQTQGSFFLTFNAILNWDHLDAGKAAAGQAGTTPPAGGGQ